MDKVIDIEERIPSMRKKRRRKTNKKFILLVALFLIVLFSLLYFQSSLSDVKQISINDDTELQEGKYYVGQSGLFIGQSLWGFKTSDIEQKLRRITGVKEASVSRAFINNVNIHLTEWKPVAYLENKEKFDLLLENGDEIATDNPDTLLHAPILSDFTERPVIEDMIEQLKEMDSSVFELVSEIHYTDEDTIKVYMNDGYEVHAAISSFAEKMQYYPEIIAQLPKEEKGVLDIEIGVFFKTFTDYYQELGQEEEHEPEAESAEQ